MGIPRQVEEAAAMAEELHKQMTEPNQEDSTTQDDAQKEEETVEDTSPQQEDEEETYRRRYESLRGKYDAEVPRLHQELKEFKQSVFEKLQQVNTPEPQQTPKENERLAKFREEYGDDFVENLKELFKSEFDPLVQQTLQPVQQHVASVEETQIAAAQQNFMNYLDGQVKGDWRSLWSGQDEKFASFLQQPDPSGLYTYGQLVQLYNDNWDADRLGRIFNTYLESSQPQKKANPAKDAMIAPSRNTNNTAPNVEEKRIWTRDMMKQFEIDDRRGKYDPETSKAMWDDLIKAAHENRIR